MKVNEKRSSRDLTDGSIAGNIILFALPILAGQLLQNLYNSVDAVVVGKFVGTTALAAVSVSSDITHFITAFFTGLSAGAGVLFSRHFGAKNPDDLKTAVHTSLLFSFLLGIGMALIGIFATPLFLSLMKCPAEVIPEAVVYLRIYFIGVLFTSLYNITGGVFRSVGDSRTPFLCLAVASAMNIILDIVFVTVFETGVAGVAIATVISQLTSLSMMIYKMLRTDDAYHLDLKALRINVPVLKEVLRLGLPSALQNCLITLSNLFIQGAINSFGTTAIAGIGAAKKIDRFIGMIPQSIGLSVTTFVGQNVGAKRIQRAKKGVLVSGAVCVAAVLVFSLAVNAFAGTAAGFFSDDIEVQPYTVAMLRVMMPLYFMLAIQNIMAGAGRGFGRSAEVMALSIAGMIVCRQLYLRIGLSFSNDIRIIYWAWPVGWLFASTFGVLFYLLAIGRKSDDELLSLKKQ